MRILMMIALLAAPLFAQGPPGVIPVPTSPTGNTCYSPIPLQVTNPGGILFTCQNGLLEQVSSGSGSAGGGQLTDATPGASPTYNWSTGVAAGTSTATTCTPLPCGSITMTLSANSTVPAFTFTSTTCTLSCTIQVNQGATAYTGYTWPSNVVGAAAVTQVANKYTLCVGYYDTATTTFRVSACSTNDKAIITATADPTIPPTNSGTAFNSLSSTLGTGTIWDANKIFPIYGGLMYLDQRRQSGYVWQANNTTHSPFGEPAVIYTGGGISNVAATATSPVMGKETTISNSPVGMNGGSTYVSGKTQGIEAMAVTVQTAVTAIRYIPLALVSSTNNITNILSTDSPSAFTVAEILATTGGSQPSGCVAANYCMVVSNAAAVTGADTGVAFATGGGIATSPHIFRIYEDSANSKWCAQIDNLNTYPTGCAANTNGPASGTVMVLTSGSEGIGQISGNWENAMMWGNQQWF